MKCWHCNSEVIWGGDHDYNECDRSGEGIVTNLSCSSDGCDTFILVYHTIEDENGKRINRK